MIRKNTLPAFLLGLLALLQAIPLAAQQVSVPEGATATTVWPYNPACGNGQDYPDVPARPFLVGLPGTPSVLWFAANSNGSYASVGLRTGPDMLAGLQRGTVAGPGCVSWLPATSYPGSAPAGYDSGLWMVVPVTPDGTHIEALVHNEFHGEWAGGTGWCWQQTPTIYLPCDYWNIVSASSSDAANSFQLRKQPAPSNANMPAIALNQPYSPPTQTPTPTMLPQGMTAQSNILQVGQYYYMLVQQLPYRPSGAPPPPQSGVCLYRAPVVPPPGGPLTWTGWNGSGYTVAVPPHYPAPNSWQPCHPQLGSQFRFSWSYNRELGQIIIIGQDAIANVGTNGCAVAPQATSTTVDAAFVYMTATLDPATGQLSAATPETCLLQINSMANWQGNPSVTGQAYPSLLDPASPELASGDLNFMFSGKSPYLYFTQLNPRSGDPKGYDRDLVRLPLAVSAGATRR